MRRPRPIWLASSTVSRQLDSVQVQDSIAKFGDDQAVYRIMSYGFVIFFRRRPRSPFLSFTLVALAFVVVYLTTIQYIFLLGRTLVHHLQYRVAYRWQDLEFVFYFFPFLAHLRTKVLVSYRRPAYKYTCV